MTRINRPDTLLTELRDIKRRLRLLEAGRMRPPRASSPAGPGPAEPVPLMPTRPTDWPGTGSGEWERLSVARVVLGERGAVVELHLAAEPDTAGMARVLVDGEAVGVPIQVSQAPSTQTIAVGPGSEVAVEARRTEGAGLVRVVALLRPE
ncbi:MAG: hypothetical protein ABR608_02055 [Pseudonocardiaceae bacterium]